MKHEDSLVQASLSRLVVLYSVPEGDAPAIQNWSRDSIEEVSYSDGRFGIDSNGYIGARIGIGFEGLCLALALTQLASVPSSLMRFIGA